MNQYGRSHPLSTQAATSSLCEEFHGEHLFSTSAKVHSAGGGPEYCLNEAHVRTGKLVLLMAVKCQVPAYLSISTLATLLLFHTSLLYIILWPTYVYRLFSRRPWPVSLPSHVALYQSVTIPFHGVKLWQEVGGCPPGTLFRSPTCTWMWPCD